MSTSKKKTKILTADDAYNELYKNQRSVVDETINKKNIILDLPMGYGKTRISIVSALKLTTKPILFITSKAAVPDTILEINKSFGNRLKYEVVQGNIKAWKRAKDTQLVIVLYSTLAIVYKQLGLKANFVLQRFVNNMTFENVYNSPDKPLVSANIGVASIFAFHWGCRIVDEIQNCSKITAGNCQAISSIVADYNLATSGTPIKNPTVPNILGCFCILNIDCPRTIPSFKAYLKSDNFPGLRAFSVYRIENEALKTPIIIIKNIVTHGMTENESKIYKMFKVIVINLNKKMKNARNRRLREQRRGGIIGEGPDHNEITRINSSLLTTVGYLRQGLVNPILPLTTISVNMSGAGNKSELSELMHREVKKLGIGKWLNSTECMFSSRIKAVFNTLDNHCSNDRVVAFISHRTSIRVLAHYTENRPDGKKGRKVFTINPNSTVNNRQKILCDFSKSKRGVMYLTYAIGSSSLNLQHANKVLLIDFDWSPADMNQAIARVARMGQLSKTVDVYYFNCGAGIEKAVLIKQLDKTRVINKLKEGKIKRLTKSIKFSEFVNDIINTDDNIELIDKIHIKKYIEAED